MTHFLGDELGHVGVDHVVDLHHLPLFHEELDDVNATFGHAVGEFLNRDRLRNDHLAHDLFTRLVGHHPALLALDATTEGGDGPSTTLAVFIIRLGGDDRQLAALLGNIFLGARRCLGNGHHRLLRDRRRTGCTTAAIVFFFVFTRQLRLDGKRRQCLGSRRSRLAAGARGTRHNWLRSQS